MHLRWALISPCIKNIHEIVKGVFHKRQSFLERQEI
jgi:hypothetical protein